MTGGMGMPEDRPRGVIRLRGPGGRARDTTLTAAAPAARIAGRGVLQANLRWPPGADVDLDLGCLVEFADGGTAVVQALGDTYGSLSSWPYVALDQDDRTGDASDGETLRVNLEHRALFRRLLFYAYVYEGAVDFRRLGAVVTLATPSAGPSSGSSSGGHRIPLDDSPPGAVACAVALVTVRGAELAVRRETRWFTPEPGVFHQERIDRAYGFGLEWFPAEKPPRS